MSVDRARLIVSIMLVLLKSTLLTKQKILGKTKVLSALQNSEGKREEHVKGMAK